MRALLTMMILLLFAVSAQAADAGRVIRKTELKEAPYLDAKTRTSLTPGERFKLLRRKGGWYRIDLGKGRRGWVPMTRVSLGGNAKRGKSGLGETLRFITTGRSGTTGVTAATGIRGLDSADVAKATPDPAAVKRLQGFADSAADARRYAAAAKLKSHRIVYPNADANNRSAAGSGILNLGGGE